MKTIKLNKEKIKNILLFGQALLLISFVFVKCDSVPKPQNDYNTPISTLSVNLIQDMIDKYTNNQLAVINESKKDSRLDLKNLPNHGDTRAVWYDLETLKKFIHQIESTVQMKGKNIGSNKLGIRIYYAAYPDKKEWKNYDDLKNFDNQNTTTYGHKHTLIFIPTIQKDKSNLDFNPLDIETYSNGLKGKKSQLKIKSNRESYQADYTIMGMYFQEKTAALNHGSAIPPFEDNFQSAFLQ